MLKLYVRTDKTQSYTGRFLGLHEEIQIPKDCSSAFDVICQRMEQRMAYGHNEQVMLNTHVLRVLAKIYVLPTFILSLKEIRVNNRKGGNNLKITNSLFVVALIKNINLRGTKLSYKNIMIYSLQ